MSETPLRSPNTVTAAALALGGLFVHADQRFVMIALGVALGGTTLTLYSLCLASANDFLTSA